MEEGRQRPEASFKVLKDCIHAVTFYLFDGLPKVSFKFLKDCIHAVKFYLFDGLPEPPCEVSYGLFFVFQNSL